MRERNTLKSWQTTIAAATFAVASVALPPSSVSAPTTSSTPATSEDDGETETSGSSSENEAFDLSARVVGIHDVSEATERRMRRDIQPKLAAHADDFRACYRTHAVGHSDPDRTVHVDWTITTDGEPVDITVFTSHTGLESCVARALRDATFAHAEDRHPRVRVKLSFR